jgi:hypothetical protein
LPGGRVDPSTGLRHRPQQIAFANAKPKAGSRQPHRRSPQPTTIIAAKQNANCLDHGEAIASSVGDVNLMIEADH